MAEYADTHTDTYLKTGSNELKVLEYSCAGEKYGINILKVNHVLSEMRGFRTVPEVHPAIRGVFNDHEKVVPVLDLGYFLRKTPISIDGRHRVIVTEFFGMLNAFLVDNVETVHTFGWDQVINAQSVLEKLENPYVISIVQPNEDQMILLLDYETIILQLTPDRVKEETKSRELVRMNGDSRKVLVAEDSSSVRDMLALELEERGFEPILARDGREALELIEQNRDVSVIISDVEMPHTDGLALTKKVKENPETAHVPVIVYSSIGDIGMKERAKFLQAEEHITKLNLSDLFSKIGKLIGESETREGG
ncbi:MAG TPA: chemotaxis protein [bacterium]|nr:chemotaxis protein [bacterium]